MLVMTALSAFWSISPSSVRRLGYYLRSIRDNENAAQAIGVGLLRNKVARHANDLGRADRGDRRDLRALPCPSSIRISSSVSPVLTVEIILFFHRRRSGLSVIGPALGAFLLAPLGEILRGQFGGSLPPLHYFIYGPVIVVAVILLMPQGLVPALLRLRQRPPTGLKAATKIVRRP